MLATAALVTFPNNGMFSLHRLPATGRALPAADPAGEDTVTGIAARWGFIHPGRFAAAYRWACGRSPSTTLQA